MANFYLQFSTVIELTLEEMAQLENDIECTEMEEGDDEDCGNVWTGGRIGCSYQFERPDPKTGEKPSLWLYSEDNCNLDRVASFLQQRFIAKLRPRERVEIRFANTCSSMRVDGFSGGTLLITKDALHHCDGVDCTNKKADAADRRARAAAVRKAARKVGKRKKAKCHATP